MLITKTNVTALNQAGLAAIVRLSFSLLLGHSRIKFEAPTGTVSYVFVFIVNVSRGRST